MRGPVMAAAPSAGPRASFLPIRSVNRTFGQAERLGYLHTLSCQPPALFFLFFSRKEVMKKIKKIGQVAWWLQVVVRVRWERFQGSVRGLYFRRVTFPVRIWRACGCPEQFRPRLPWWQPFVWRWLVISGAAAGRNSQQQQPGRNSSLPDPPAPRFAPFDTQQRVGIASVSFFTPRGSHLPKGIVRHYYIASR